MTPKQNCDDWLTYVYREWMENLARVEQESFLRTSTRNMVTRMRRAVDAENVDEAWSLLERLKKLNAGFDAETNTDKQKYEKPESYMECALAAYKLGDLNGSLELFRVSTGDFPPNSAYKAICHWMMGCVQWQIPSRFESAVLSWERGLQVMDSFVTNQLERTGDEILKSKGNNILNHMRMAIDDATFNGSTPPPPSDSSVSEGAAARHRRRPKDQSASSEYGDFFASLAFLPYFGEIPAGDPKSALQYPDEMFGLDSLNIGGRSYNLFSLKRDIKEIRMLHDTEYFLMKADGNSMNTARPIPIESGDYVLLKNAQQPENNDIVAAVIFGQGEPETATLKVYHQDDGGRHVMSASNKITIHIKMSDADYIQGVVIAILKPADD